MVERAESGKSGESKFEETPRSSDKASMEPRSVIKVSICGTIFEVPDGLTVGRFAAETATVERSASYIKSPKKLRRKLAENRTKELSRQMTDAHWLSHTATLNRAVFPYPWIFKICGGQSCRRPWN